MATQQPFGTLDGKTALITGASSGIGRATALMLASAGAAVAIGARRADRLTDLAHQIPDDNGRVLQLDLDVSDESSCRAAADRTTSSLGQIDILVNVAGVMLLGPIVGADTEDWRRMFATNTLGTMYMTAAVVPGMVERGSGHIVNLTSVAARVVRPNAGAYNASKWAANAFTEALRQEVTTKGVRVTQIEPGDVDTELTSHITNDKAKQAAQDSYSSMRILDPDDVARAVLYALTQPTHVAVNEILIRPTDEVEP